MLSEQMVLAKTNPSLSPFFTEERLLAKLFLLFDKNGIAEIFDSIVGEFKTKGSGQTQ
jgi:hypothetical protein